MGSVPKSLLISHPRTPAPGQTVAIGAVQRVWWVGTDKAAGLVLARPLFKVGRFCCGSNDPHRQKSSCRAKSCPDNVCITPRG